MHVEAEAEAVALVITKILTKVLKTYNLAINMYCTFQQNIMKRMFGMPLP
jgi:hypothetical protein